MTPDAIRLTEGFRRVRSIARWLMLFGVPAGLLLWIGAYAIRGGGGLADLVVLVGLPLLGGGTLLLFVWVFEGFFLGRDSG
jgi:hypothetical protein